MKSINIKTPAKINLTLEVLNKREDGFHNIQSIMQTISLYDYLTITIEDFAENTISLGGTSNEIPYDEKNIVYKAWKLFCEEKNIKNKKVTVFIEKNIPVSAGLAGGSTNAAGFLKGLNSLLDNICTKEELHTICARLGSDLNFCLDGGCALCTSRGEKIEKLPSLNKTLSLVKPKNLGISAKEAYTRFAALPESFKKIPDNTQKLAKLIKNGQFDESLIYNSLESALLGVYDELAEIKRIYPTSLMSGSGSTFFVFDNANIDLIDPKRFLIFDNLNFVSGCTD